LRYQKGETQENNQQDTATCQTVTMRMRFEPSYFPLPFTGGNFLLCISWVVLLGS